MDNDSVIFSNADLGYNRRLPALREVNLTLRTSAIYGLFGENGSGKTTLLNTLTGGVPLLSGFLTVNGFAMPSRTAEFLGSVFYVPQYPCTAPLSLTDFANCYGPFYPRFSHEQFADNTSLFAVDTYKKLSKMSPGEIKKALLVFAFAANTPLLILDEPLNALDMGGKKAFQTMLAQTDTTERTILISSHSATELQNLITDVVMLYGRRVAIDASVTSLAETFTFGSAAEFDDDILFEDGLKTISRNTRGVYSDPDIELLYSAVHQSEYFRNIISATENP